MKQRAGAARLLVALALACAVRGSYIHFNGMDPNDPLKPHIHIHSETLDGRIGKSHLPYIDFEVSCPDVKSDTLAYVSWAVFHSKRTGLGLLMPSGESRVNYPTIFNFDPTTGRPLLPAHCPSRPKSTNSTASGSATTAAPTAHTTAAPAAKTNGSRRRDADEEAAWVRDKFSGFLVAKEAMPELVYSNCMPCTPELRGLSHDEVMKLRGLNKSGYYTLAIQSFRTAHPEELVRIEGFSVFKNVHGYLSSSLTPLATFFAVMGFLYLVIGLVWVALMACHYYDLLRLQFWIGGVILLGMLEMAVGYGDLDYLNRTGNRSQFLLVFSKLLFAAKHTLARLLVLVVSMGFGVVKPRLGNAAKQLAAIGCSYFFFSAAFGVTHAMGQQAEVSKDKAETMVVIPLAVLDSAIIWWIFLSLSHTIRILELRNNVIKLALYIRFKWVLTVSVTATVLFALWTLYDRFGFTTVTDDDWRNDWLQEAYWDMLFFGILLGIMWLWRPSENNSRYAYAPLETDLDDDEEFSGIVPNYKAETLHMRSLTSRGKEASSRDDVEEDLKWVEDNIPSSAITSDTAFPPLLDSDEELANTRFELSKMD